MVRPEIKDNILHIYVQGMDKIWAFKSRLSVPLGHITAARIDSEVTKKRWHGLRFPGTNIPGIVTAGTFYSQGRRVFWDVHRAENVAVISLKDEKYDEIIIQVEDPDLFVKEIQDKVQ